MKTRADFATDKAWHAHQDAILRHWGATRAEHDAAQADLAARRTRSGSYQDSEARMNQWVDQYQKTRK